MSIQKAIQNIRQKNLDEMKTNLQTALTEKAVQKLEEKKVTIANSYFAKKKLKEDDNEDELNMLYGTKVNGKRSNERTNSENSAIDQMRQDAKKMMGGNTSNNNKSGTNTLKPTNSFNNSSGIENF